VLDEQLTRSLADSADLIFHLAAAVGVRSVLNSTLRSIQINTYGTDNVLAAAAHARKRVVVASSSEVYGKSTDIPLRESSAIVIGPTTVRRWSYACSKALDEFLALAYFEEAQVPVTVVRLFNTVGPRQTHRFGMVLPMFLRQALSNESITVYGSGKQRRCFTYVADVIETLVRLMSCDAAAGEVINVGNDEEISMLDLAITVKRVLGSRSHIVFIPYDQAYSKGFEDVDRRVPSLEKVNRLIGYRPRTSLEQVVRLTAEHMALKCATAVR
jgi:UDP-glucose 4-epimerase